ncbi:MAG: site-specific integrase [Candidatus Rokubacteria bacterium]|nr:site-specific integrase [Candidatus Rokubacteria bacterium]
MGAVAEGRAIVPRADRVPLAEVLDNLQTDYAVNGRVSAKRLGESLKHLRDYFGNARAVAVDTAAINRYIAARQAPRTVDGVELGGAANATINRELAALSRAFSLAVQGNKLPSKPYIPRLSENNTRQGFFEPDQLVAVLANLPAAESAVVRFGAITGWRLRECLTLTWSQVDFAAGMVRLEPGTTKNKEGRVFPFTEGLRAVLEAQRAATEAFSVSTGRIIPYVFHRRGKRIASFYGAWRRACIEAGCPGRLFHDLRRTAVRALERANVSRSVAMRLTGHKTESVYRRYAIVSEGDLRDAVDKLAATTVRSTPVTALSAARMRHAARK